MSHPKKINECPIWPSHKARVLGHVNGGFSVKCSPRAGGGYEISSGARALLRKDCDKIIGDEVRALLTTMLVDKRVQGIELPFVNSDLVEKAKTRPEIPVDQRAERLLRFISGQAKNLASVVEITRHSYEAYAWSESIQWGEVLYLLEYLKEMGWIKGQFNLDRLFSGKPTVAGYQRIAEQRINLDSSQVFVAMWFDKSMKQAFEAGIVPAVKQAGYKAFRIDLIEHVDKIEDKIIAELRRSRFVVADFTHGKKGARGGVYYEAGFAHGLDLPVIFTCKEDVKTELHFDTEHYNHIFWANPEELRKKLKTRILAVIGEGPEAHSNP